MGNGHIAITDKGRQALVLKRCIDVAASQKDPLARLDGEVATFLGKKDISAHAQKVWIRDGPEGHRIPGGH